MESPTVPGIYPDVPEQVYHRGAGISQSALKTFGDKSPKHYKYELDNPKKPTGAMQFGSLLHTTILQPEHLIETTVKGPNCERRSKADKANWESFYSSVGDRIMLDANGAVVTRSEDGKWMTDHELNLELADTIKFSMMENPLAVQALAEGKSEVSLYSEDEETGILKRCRIDRLHDVGNAIADVKTTEDASPKAFMKSIANFGYHIQAAYYLDICNDLDLGKECFIIIAQEKKPPYATATYQIAEEAIDIGRGLYRMWLNRLSDCIAKDEWPGYAEKYSIINLPAWAR